MNQELGRSPLLSIAVGAVRNDGAPGWHMVSLPCPPEQVSENLAELYLRGVRFRVVWTGQTETGCPDWFLSWVAREHGWDRDRPSGAWFPIDEPLPVLPATDVQADVALALKSIQFGWAAITIKADSKLLELGIDDYQDSSILLVRFIQLLAAGGEPHACLADRATTSFVVQNGPNQDLCRFYVEAANGIILDMLTDRQALVGQFRSLATAIADHPNFAHHFTCFGSLPPADFDAVNDAAEKEWEAGVESGRFRDDYDAQEQFVAARIVAKIRLSESCKKFASEEAAMLRTLEIPIEQLEHYGLIDRVANPT